jgi:predicted kinase
MRKLVMCKGLPGSGKTTWAKEEQKRLLAEGIIVYISTKDDIRESLTRTGWSWSREAEKDVIQCQNNDIKAALQVDDRVVIVADTNFGKHEDRLRGIANHLKVVFEVRDFTDVPLQTCIERDAQREKPVGEQVIREMHQKYLANELRIVPYVPPAGKNPAIICDLDGTLALANGKRSPYDYKKVGLDDVNDPVARIVQLFNRAGYTILYVSGREDSCRGETAMWLAENKLGVHTALHMRKTGDHRNDAVVKLEIFNQCIRENYDVKFVLDDRDRVVRMWRELGLTCLQVAYGAF